MPASRSTRTASPRRAASAVIALLVLLVVAGCGQQEPDKYNAKVEKSFVQGCTGQVQTDSGTADTTASVDTGSASGSAVKLGTQKSCQCVYDRLIKNVDIKDFKKANAKLQENPSQTLPAIIADQVKACQGTTSTSSTTTAPASSSSTTTAPASSSGDAGSSS